MASRLSGLFDERLKRPDTLVAGDPQSLETISEKVEEQNLVLQRVKNLEDVELKVDYSDFSNFVFFNSALDYFNITGEKILNEYPYDGSVDQIQAFLDDLDGYQRYLVSVWPKTAGNLRFDPSVSASYVAIDDIGVDSGVQRAAFLSPNTGSWSIEFWSQPPPVLTGSNDAMFVLQKSSGSNGYSVYFSGSNVYFRFVSGSSVDQVSTPFSPGSTTYFSCVLDRAASTPLISISTGSLTTFPVVATSASATVLGSLNLGAGRMYIASGTLSGKITRPMTGSIDDVRLWNSALSLVDLTSSFNTKAYAQENLVGLWRFNETSATGSNYAAGGESAIVYDFSGHRINGRIQNYYPAIRSSGSLLPFESPDLVLSFNAPQVQSLVLQQQTSGSIYDRDNDNIITHLFPESFFLLEDEKQTTVLQNFIFILARQFDHLKISIDQFLNVLRSNYTDFNQAPDAVLTEIGEFFGWEFTGNFLCTDAFQYLLGLGVLANTDSNRELDTKLFEIKNEFWRRSLINLMYLYKTKGTRESVEALMRIYGVNKNFVRLKEYGYMPNVGFNTFRISAEKSVHALALGSGSAVTSSFVQSPSFYTKLNTVETRVRFPLSTSPALPATVLTGSIWSINSGSSAAPMLYQLYWTKTDASSQTGSLFLTSSEGNVSLPGIGIFDDRWYNIAFTRDPLSSSLGLEVRSIDVDEIDVHLSASASYTLSSAARPLICWLGATGSTKTQQWTQEFRVWSQVLDQVELDDHALNFQSYGTKEVLGDRDLDLHWRLRENVSSSVSGDVTGIYDYSGNGRSGTGQRFVPSQNPYIKFLEEYNYIASPDFGWNEEKIRVFDTSVVKPSDAFSDDGALGLEFNLVDALNEDISQLLSTMDGWNNSIGMPVHRYRAVYQDLEKLREEYFKKLSGQLNFRVFADMLEFFDRSFVDMVRKLIPARAVFFGDEFVVESHMLERPKLQWNYRRRERDLEPEGVIQVIVRI